MPRHGKDAMTANRRTNLSQNRPASRGKLTAAKRAKHAAKVERRAFRTATEALTQPVEQPPLAETLPA